MARISKRMCKEWWYQKSKWLGCSTEHVWVFLWVASAAIQRIQYLGKRNDWSQSKSSSACCVHCHYLACPWIPNLAWNMSDIHEVAVQLDRCKIFDNHEQLEPCFESFVFVSGVSCMQSDEPKCNDWIDDVKANQYHPIHLVDLQIQCQEQGSEVYRKETAWNA